MLSGSSRMPGSTSLAPVPAAAKGRPQALAWNSGTMSMMLSRADTAMTSAAIATKECSICERWLYSTPFGLPVVPDV